MHITIVAPQVTGLIKGGLRYQAVQTAKHLAESGYKITLFNYWDPPDWSAVDIVHLFQANATTLQMAEALSDSDIHFVVSPVTYTTHSPTFVKASRKIEDLTSFLTPGIRSDYDKISKICSLCSHILPNTTAEARLFQYGFEVPASKITTVPNGVEEHFANVKPELFRDNYGLSDFILFVGNVGAERKNALRLIEVLSQIPTPSVIIGKIFDNEYARKCLSLAKEHEHIHIIGEIDHDSKILASAYAACKLFILPSLFETPGIAALEAALAGANIAITEHGGTYDYFEDDAVYLDPRSKESIKNAIEKGLKMKKNTILKKRVENKFLWQHVADQTAEVYKSVKE